MGSFDGRLHAPNHLAVKKCFHRHGVRVGNKMPERQDVFVGLKPGERDDLEFGELELAVNAKNQRRQRAAPLKIRTQIRAQVAAGVKNLYRLGLEPVGEINDIDGGQRQCGKDEEQIFFVIKFCNAARARRGASVYPDATRERLVVKINGQKKSGKRGRENKIYLWPISKSCSPLTFPATTKRR